MRSGDFEQIPAPSERRPLAPGAAAATSEDDALDVVDHLDLVEIATRSVPVPAASSLDRDDLIGEGQVALVQAAQRYDPSRGRFRNYAFIRIKGAMIDALRRDFLVSRHGRKRGHRVTVVSMDKPIGESELTLADTIADKSPPVDEIVAQRERLADALARRDAGQPVQPKPPPPPQLTNRELEVLRGAANGETTKETAARLGKSFETIKDHRKSAIRRLGARSIAQAIFIAYEEITV
jgi:RNA polymerase sigma factor (sigma-70 family)